MGVAMLLITKQSCCILLGIQMRTLLLVPLEIACTCTMVSHITQPKKKEIAVYIIIIDHISSLIIMLDLCTWKLLYRIKKERGENPIERNRDFSKS